MRAIGESYIKDKRTKGRDKEGTVRPELTAPGIQMHLSHKKRWVVPERQEPAMMSD